MLASAASWTTEEAVAQGTSSKARIASTVARKRFCLWRLLKYRCKVGDIACATLRCKVGDSAYATLAVRLPLCRAILMDVLTILMDVRSSHCAREPAVSMQPYH